MAKHKQLKPGTLYIVPTPIGNLEDMTLRGLKILKEVNYIAAEDTRHSRKLCSHFDIKTPLISYYREKEQQKAEVILELLKKGSSIALVSDAGTPAISDPGVILVQKAHAHEIEVVPLPGPCALTTAMSGAGIVADGFLFRGFLPAKSGQRRKTLKDLSTCQYPLILYESVHRIKALISDTLELFGDREVVWARELTKSFEELEKTTLLNLLQNKVCEKVKGELVLIICPAEEKQVSEAELLERINWYRDTSTASLKDAAKEIAEEFSVSKSKVYKLALSVWKRKESNEEI